MYHAKDLFQAQSELVEAKVDMAVSQAIDRVIHRINDLENKMNTRFSSLENLMTAVETRLGMVNETDKEIRSKLMEYAFRAAYAIGATIVIYVLIHLHALS